MPKAARHPGRRPAADPKVIEHHTAKILAAIEKRKAAEAEVQEALDEIAAVSDAAMQAGVQTNYVADLLEVTRQAVYKLVNERVYGGQAATRVNGAKPAQVKKARSSPMFKKGKGVKK